MAREYERERIIPPLYVGVPAHLNYEVFESAKYTAEQGIGTDYERSLSYTFARNGYSGLRLRTKASNPAVNDYVLDDFFMALLPFTSVEVSTEVLVEGTTHDYQVSLVFFAPYNSKDYYWVGELDVEWNTGKVYLIDETGAQVLIETIGDLGERHFTYMSFIMDLRNEKYSKVRIGSYEIDIPDTKIYKATGLLSYNVARVGIANLGTNRALAFFDNIIIKSVTA